MKRGSPMKRSTPLRSAGVSTDGLKPIRPKRCEKRKGGCGEQFTPRRPFQKWCSPDCGASMAKLALAKEKAKEATADRQLTRAQREAQKRLPELRAEAQAAFNDFIRLRDRMAGHPCICCGQGLDWASKKPGGSVDAGHYLSRGSTPELAFDPRNVNAQRKGCNRPGGTTRASFRAGMVRRYGEAVVAELEGPHPMPRHTRDDYRKIRDHFRTQLRQLKKESKP